MKRTLLGLALCLALTLSLCPAFAAAAEEGAPAAVGNSAMDGRLLPLIEQWAASAKSAIEAIAPGENADRASCLEAMWKLGGCLDSAAEMTFTDVDPDSVTAKAARWGLESGVFTGYSDKTFGVGDPLTREQLVTVIWRFAAHEGMDMTVPQGAAARCVMEDFPDATAVSDYARDAMAWACGVGIMVGSDGQLEPQSFCTRENLTVIYQRCLTVIGSFALR